MTEVRTQRRLAAILAADVVGYSRLIRADEDGTLAAFKSLRADFIEPKLSAHGGRIFKLMGDGMLVEFSSVVEAVRASAELQRALAEHNAGLAEGDQMVFRIGINLGDVVVDGDDIHGDGVNVASRLEGLAEPGGICVSGGVYDQVRDRLDLAFEDTGEQTIKNIDRPIKTYAWRPGVAATVDAPAPSREDKAGRKPTIAFSGFESVGRNEDAEVLAAAVTDAVALTFANQTGFSLITDATQTDYLAKGNILALGSRYRATVQIVDRRSGEQFASDRFEGDLGNLFEAQDDLAYRVASTVRFSINRREFERAGQDDQSDDATEKVLTKAAYLLLGSKRADWVTGLEMVEQVLARDPKNFMALAMKATGHLVEAFVGYRQVPARDGMAALAAARRAVQLNERSDFAHLAKAYVHLNYEGDLEAAKRENERVVELNPNYPLGTHNLGMTLIFAGDAEAGISLCTKAVEAASRLPLQPALMVTVALGYFSLERYGEALQWARRSDERLADVPPTLLTLATAAWHAGEHDVAKTTLDRLLALEPEASLATLRRLPFGNAEHWLRYTEGLRAAGLPE